MQRLTAIGVCLMCLGCAPARSATPALPAAVFVPEPAEPVAKAKITALAPQLDAFLHQRFSASGATGMVAGIVLQGELVYEHSFGTLGPTNPAPVSGDTIFRIASLSKSFTALGVLQLRDAGKLQLDQPITAYLPEVPSPAGDAAPVTVRQLLTHVAGLPWDDLWGAVSFGFREPDMDEFLRAGVSFAREPGSAFEYSNVGYALLGRLIARVSRRRFEEYMAEHILLPLGMRSTRWRADAVPVERLAVGDWGGDPPLGEVPRQRDGVFAPAGGMYTSLHDYARYLAFQLSAYPARPAAEQGPVRRSTVRETHRPQQAALRVEQPIAERSDDGVSLHVSHYGFGWFNEMTCDYRERVEHGGWEPGYIAGVIMFPAQRVAVVTMATSNPVGSAEGMLALLGDAGALPTPIEPEPAAELSEARHAVSQLLNGWDDATAQRVFDPRCAYYPWFARVRAAFPKLAREHGRCEPDGELRTGSRLQGSWNMRCERGAVQLSVELTPTAQPRIALLRFTELLPPGERMTARAAQLAAAVGGPVPEGMLPANVDPEPLRKRLAHAAIDHGHCTVDRATAGDGHTQATFALHCEHAPLELVVSLNETGEVTTADLHRPRESRAPCWR